MEEGPAREAASAGQVVQSPSGQAEPPTRAKKGQESRVPSVPGLEFPRYFTLPGVDPFDEVEWEIRSAVIGNEKGKVVFEQRDVEIPRFWSQQATNIVVSKYFRGQIGSPRARAERETAHRPGGGHHHVLGARAEVLRQRGHAPVVLRRAEAPAGVSEGGVQQSRLVQLRFREGPAVLGLLHQLRAGHHGLDPDAGQDRRDVVQVRVGHRQQPVVDPVVQGASRRRRDCQRSRVLHEGLRCVCRRDQVRRQDPPGGEDGDPERRPSRHRRVHQLQGRRREEGVGAHRRRL